jgi:hypothetical protein
METMLYCMGENASCPSNVGSSTSVGIGHLSSYPAETLNNCLVDAFGYNNCLFGSTLEAALMKESVIGENTAC